MGAAASTVNAEALAAASPADLKAAADALSAEDKAKVIAALQPAAPESVAFFFNGEAMAGKAEKWMADYVADDIMLSFIGPYAPPVPPLDKEHMGGAIGNLIKSFPDFTFNPKAHAKHVAAPAAKDGGFAADIVVTGKHTGDAFTPMPGKLDAVEKTDKEVTIGPETFTLYVNADGKVNKITIQPLHEGAPAGPPGFYTEIGGKMPAPPAAEAAAPAAA